jgi:glucose-6-phosphate dehydrogenase assembly protein OpcA
MAVTVAERRFRASTPEGIESDLAALWRALGQGATPIARAVMSNLVVFRSPVTAPDDDVENVMADIPLEEVAARHPSRVIVIEHERGSDQPHAPFAAGVGVITFGPESARYGVEQVVVRSACAEASLPSIIRRLTRGDLPTSVWWTEDLSQVPPLEALVTMGRQLVYDSRDWSDVSGGLRVLAPIVGGRRIDLADTNWRRLVPLRRAISHVQGRPLAPAGARQHITHRPDEAALAWLLAGVLMASADRAGAEPPAVEASSDIGDALLVVTIDNAASRVTITLSASGATIADASAAAPFVVSMPIESKADAVAAELRTLSQDAELYAALAALVQRFGAR